MVGAGVSIPDNLTYKGVFGLDSKLETMEFNLESNKDYEGLTSIKAGESGGDILTALLGGTITSARFTTDAEGVVLAVPTAGTVTVPLEEVGATEVAVGGEITTRSLAGLGDDLDSTFQYADKGEGTSGKWNQGSFDSGKNSLEYHFNKHGKEVGAKDADQYLRKAEEFARNLRGAKRYRVQGEVDGVTRYVKNGKYIDLAPDGTIISFGKR
ncbi:hypothetical protein ACJDT4_21730 [Clostridium neuense]|uniref:Uncharacterized protein n=1 Tax=Clostridium neuense TaxID=1728934 RepID=A0ABW8TL95_9CLOT